MKVAQQTETMLVLDNKGIGGIIVLAGLIFFAIDLAVLVVFGQAATLTCNRGWAEAPCVLERTLFGFPLKAVSLDSLRSARVDESEDSEGDTTYRVVLVMREGEQPLTWYYGSGRQSKERFVTEVNAFLATPSQQTLEVTDGSPWIGFSIGLSALIGGAIAAFGLQFYRSFWIFDKTQGLVQRARKTWIGWKVLEEYPLSQVTDAWVDVSEDSDGDTYRVVLTMLGGEQKPMTSFYMSGREGMDESAAAIREFLGTSRDSKRPYGYG